MEAWKNPAELAGNPIILHVQWVVLELKILHNSLDKTITDGLQQVTAYAQQCGADEAHLVIFNRHPNVAWEDKIWHQTHEQTGRSVDVWGLKKTLAL